MNKLLAVLIFTGLMSCTPEPVQEKTSSQLSEWPRGVTYSIFVRSFKDSNGDGIGDLNGVRDKLDYLIDLGVEVIWLMPISPSPSYHKYDVTDYYGIDPEYGTMEDFKALVNEAHSKGIRVILDLVVNHCSSQHPWFKEAKKDPNSQYRDYFTWATPKEIEAQGNVVKKEVTEDSDNINWWNEVEGQEEKYYAYFWSEMPDFNYDNEEVKQEMFKVGKFWLQETGVDGFRLDAAKHIFPDERPQDNHEFWIEFRQEMESVKPQVHLVGEVWDKAEVVAPYLAGLRSNFNFDLGDAIVRAVTTSDGTGLVDNYREISNFYKAITDDFIDATFVRNHDQNRIMSIVENSAEKAKLAVSILLTLPGSPYLYYGEEIGMRGMKPDEYIREPFIWDTDSGAQASWIKPKYNSPETVDPVSLQLDDPNSVLNHYKSLIKLRKGSPILSSGSLEPSPLDGDSFCAFIRKGDAGSIEVIHNLSDKAQTFDSERSEVIYQSDEVVVGDGSYEMPPFSTIILK